MTKKQLFDLAAAHGITIELEEAAHKDDECWSNINLPKGFTWHGSTGICGTYYKSDGRAWLWNQLAIDLQEMIDCKADWQPV
jgi:hypothetical protein